MLTKRFILKLFIISLLSAMLVACDTGNPGETQPLSNSEHQRMYRFQGNPAQPTTLQLHTELGDITFSASVADYTGRVITTLNDTSLQTIQLTVPEGDVHYLVTIASSRPEWTDSVQLALNPGQSVAQPPPSRTMNIAYVQSAPTVCEIWIDQSATVYLYDRPVLNATALLVLPVNVWLQAEARTIDGWYRVSIDTHKGWINSTSLTLNGDCASLPVDTMMQPTATASASITAPFDVDRHYFPIDAEQGSTFTNTVSYPNGDSTDTIQATLSNNQLTRHIGMIMSCQGTGTEALRWGTMQNESLSCGDTLTLTLNPQTHDAQLLVMLPAVNGQQYVQYQLQAMPIAPADEDQHVMPLDKNQGGIIQQTISYPAGDQSDILALYAHNLEEQSPNNYRQYTLIMRCTGNGVEHLRWGIGQQNLRCEDSFSVSMVNTDNVKYLTVAIEGHNGQAFVDYVLYAVPSAPVDEAYWFGVDRDYGGIFSEVISAPLGDNADTVELVMSNLTSNTPNAFREMTLTLQCKGYGKENIRWGLPGNPNLLCDQTVTTAFTYSASNQSIVVVPVDSSVQTYVSYSVIVATKQPEAILKNAG